MCGSILEMKLDLTYDIGDDYPLSNRHNKSKATSQGVNIDFFRLCTLCHLNFSSDMMEYVHLTCPFLRNHITMCMNHLTSHLSVPQIPSIFCQSGII